MSVNATAKGVKISPRKLGEIVALVRGRTVDDALIILNHTPRRGAVAVQKVIESARANATHNHNFKSEGLNIIEIGVTPGPSLKRYRPAAHGRALPFKRRSSHIRVVIDGTLRPAPKPKAAAKETAKAVTKEETKETK
jgi:large subunit ribosomal protein L22